ncbi:hypothetical protein RGU75_08980 [Glaciimonas sp. CA11.2]|uniref:phospholipase D-like domain-containing protein n=2 Tax=Glaciimonas sp. CA11.2 TaxID=3048601 RepID=UPI002AB4D7EA|nr:phospholipase D-like domain-containing protein [Glaciimonas sp. CA11.2]MDY7546367.1 hypothetical protein [Glaciimonas sp. CA11.2]
MPPNIKDLFFTETTHVDEVNCRATMSRQWLLENRNGVGRHPISVDNHLDFYICASEAFPHIVKDINAAIKSIDLICWGFDPGMEVTDRNAKDWPRSTTYGDLLRERASSGVTVRLLVWFADGWFGPIGRVASNLYGHPKWGRANKSDPNYARAKFCEDWWDDAMAGRIPNLHVRYRSADAGAITASLKGETPGFTDIEVLGLIRVATHHQKPILIDVELREEAVGYVMGLNSTTDYWDTPAHLYNDERRGHQREGGADKRNSGLGLKPFRDYAIRVKGKALHCLNRNFVTAWDKAKRNWDPVPESSKVSAIQGETGKKNSNTSRAKLVKDMLDETFKGPIVKLGRGDSQPGRLQSTREAITPDAFRLLPSGTTRQMAQIVRTQPEESDKTIQEAYWLATSQARNYLYIENQYFQYTPWAEHLKAMRKRYVKRMRECGWGTNVPDLYVFIVIPEAERHGMVPRTYDTVAELGQAQTMKNYDEAVRQQREWSLGFFNQWIATPFKKLMSLGRLIPSIDEITKADIVDSAARAPVSEAELDDMGIKVLIAKLYTQDSHSNRCREIYIHSKLMIIDDVFLTLGSANMNVRSMVVDSEINISCVNAEFARGARERVWGNLAGEEWDGGDGNPLSIQKTHEGWVKKMKENAKFVDKQNGRIQDFIVTYSDQRGGTGVTGVRVAQAPAAATYNEALA